MFNGLTSKTKKNGNMCFLHTMSIIQRLLSAIKGKGCLSQFGQEGDEGFRVAEARGLGKVGKYVNDQKAAVKRFLRNVTYFFKCVWETHLADFSD